jgi:hypothetical protein
MFMTFKGLKSFNGIYVFKLIRNPNLFISMYKPFILRNYANMKYKDLLLFFNDIITKMSGNANFPLPTPALLVLIGLRDAFSRLIDEASNGDRLKKTARDLKMKEVVAALDELAIYVKSVGKEDIEVLQSSGFKLEKGTLSPKLLGPVEEGKFVQGKNIGQIVSKCKGVKNKLTYNHCITEYPATPDSKWAWAGDSSSEHTFDVTPGQQYVGYIQAIGSKGQVTVSPMFTIRAAQA